MIRNGVVYTPHADSCLPGITRALIIEICKEHQISISEKNLSITEFYIADEVFTTGTMGELTKVDEIDGRKIGRNEGESLLKKINSHFEKLTLENGISLPF